VGRIDDDCAAQQTRSKRRVRRQWRDKYFSWVRRGQLYCNATQLARWENMQVVLSCLSRLSERLSADCNCTPKDKAGETD
jgi:hypothetical protein